MLGEKVGECQKAAWPDNTHPRCDCGLNCMCVRACAVQYALPISHVQYTGRCTDALSGAIRPMAH